VHTAQSQTSRLFKLSNLLLERLLFSDGDGVRCPVAKGASTADCQLALTGLRAAADAATISDFLEFFQEKSLAITGFLALLGRNKVPQGDLDMHRSLENSLGAKRGRNGKHLPPANNEHKQ
jgi:hypothetical protein